MHRLFVWVFLFLFCLCAWYLHSSSQNLIDLELCFIYSHRQIQCSCKIVSVFYAIERFHSRGQHLCKFIGTKESVCIRKEFKTIVLAHQHGRRFIVLEHQFGGRDVMWKRSILGLEAGGTPYDGLYGEGSSKFGTFLRKSAKRCILWYPANSYEKSRKLGIYSR